MARARDPVAEPDDFQTHREHTVHYNATEARQQFFALLTKVVADPEEVVLIEHKDLPARGMLVGETYRTYVRQLERLVKSLSKELQPHGKFRLAGTMTLRGDLNESLSKVRADAATRGASKLTDV